MRISDDEPRQSMIMMMLISLSRIFVGRPFGILFSYDVPDVFGLSFSYLEHHPWLRFLVNKPEIATAPISCQLSGYLFIATQKYITKKRSWSYNETILVLAVQVE